VQALARLRDGGVACWIASHDAELVAATCQRAVVLATGRVAFDGPLEGLWADVETAAQLGIDVPRAAVLAGRLRAAGVDADGILAAASGADSIPKIYETKSRDRP
jgi:ABC-type uncharacterized transport system ATPase subunit